ncbi:hypothetical protein MXB_3465 [Myxobolus squamalis]|nr:hypothetical protein MXB_3465 [Myxobolus squamalis]
MVIKYDILVEKVLKLIFKSYSSDASKNSNTNSCVVDNKSHNFPIFHENSGEEFKNILEIMHNGILLPPCRKKKPMHYDRFNENRYKTSEISHNFMERSGMKETELPNPLPFYHYDLSDLNTFKSNDKSLII